MIIKLPAYRPPDYPLPPVNGRRDDVYILYNGMCTLVFEHRPRWPSH